MSVLAPTTSNERNLGGFDFFLLWVGAGIALPEIWAGGLLLPLGLLGGALAILLGHIIGNTPMALSGIIGSRHGVPAMVSTRGALGNRGSYLPAILNCIQLVGWTAVMLWIGGHAAARLTSRMNFPPQVWIISIGILTTLWAMGGHRIWKWLQRIGVFFLLILTVAMTWIAVTHYGLRELLKVQPTSTLSFPLGLDLVIAMPISWMPLVSDYSRYATNTRTSFWGTWIGYLLASSWMYLVGLGASLATQSSEPDVMVLNLMQGQGLLGAAVLIVLFSTFTTTFLDIYSNAISVRSLFPHLPERMLILAGGFLGTLIAAFFPAIQYQNFLLFIGSAFCPLFGLVLADYFLLRKMEYKVDDLFQKGRYWYWKGFNRPALIAWTAGFILYQTSFRCGWVIGASLPGMIVAGVIYLALINPLKKGFNEDMK